MDTTTTTPDDADGTVGTGTGRVSPRAARIVGRGRGTWYRATTRRIRPDDAGFVIDAADGRTPFVIGTGGSVSVRMSPAADAAVAAVVAAHMSDDAAVAAIHTAAGLWATARGSRRVWDIDVAAAVGASDPFTADGVNAWRRTYGIAARSVAAAWPARVDETPRPGQTVAGDAPPVVDAATGRVVGA